MNQYRAASLAKFASDARLPLVSVSDDGALSIRVQEGGRAKLVGGPHRSSHSIFCLAVWGSLHLDGQPVRCTGIVPGVSLRVATGATKLSGVDPGDLASDIWHAVRARLADWVANGPAGARKFGMSSGDGIEVEFGWDSETTVRPGVMQIDVEYAKAFERAYIASRGRRPLIELALGEPEPAIAVETSYRATLIRSAMDKTIMADSPLFERLPIPVLAGKDMPCPGFHQRAPLLEQVRPVVRGFDFVRDSMREGSLGKISSVTVLAGPVAKA